LKRFMTMAMTVLVSAGVAACSQEAPAPAPTPETGIVETPAAPVQEAPPAIEAPAPAVATPVAPQPEAQVRQSQTNQGTNMLDDRLVGTWVNEKQINSGGGAGGFASFSTVMTMELGADGGIRQYTQSVGGGGDWSSNSGRTLDFEGQWRAEGGKLLVHGMGLPDFTPAAVYSFSGNYLVTNNDQGRLIWQRR
jgi:hypothetical protein